jgi:hypothetical protein
MPRLRRALVSVGDSSEKQIDTACPNRIEVAAQLKSINRFFPRGHPREGTIGKRVKIPHCPATVNGDESRNNATDE